MEEKFSKEAYTQKILSATPLALVNISYELALHYIEDALSATAVKDWAKYESSIKAAQDFIEDLRNALDMTMAISNDLFDLYLYLNKILISAFFSKDTKHLLEAKALLETLQGGFMEIESEEGAQAAVKKARKHYDVFYE